MRCFRPVSRWSRGSLTLSYFSYLLPLCCILFSAVHSQAAPKKSERPSSTPRDPSKFSGPQPRPHRLDQSLPFPSPSSAAGSEVAVSQLPYTPPALQSSFASSSLLASPAVSGAATQNSVTIPPSPPSISQVVPPLRPSFPSYLTSVAPVRLNPAAEPLPQPANQIAPILRGVCNIPAFNPCVPLAECVPSVPLIGEARCICPPGYVGDGYVNGQGCNDINECATNENDCDPRTTVCIDIPGSFRCDCLPGFTMAPNGRTCLDIDECQSSALNDCDPLTMTCHNLEGGYKCVCDSPQKIMDEVTKKCRDLNECEDLGGIMNPCEQLCEDRVGGFRCACRAGYQIAPNGVSCLDIDECVDPVLNACDPAGVVSRCENLVGGYRCICNEALGFQNGPDGIACVNLDECARNPYICGGALSCCKDLFPPQRFACTVPVDDVLGHTPPLGGVTAYGINTALGGSSLTNWIPSFLGIDSNGMLAVPKKFRIADIIAPGIQSEEAHQDVTIAGVPKARVHDEEAIQKQSADQGETEGAWRKLQLFKEVYKTEGQKVPVTPLIHLDRGEPANVTADNVTEASARQVEASARQVEASAWKVNAAGRTAYQMVEKGTPEKGDVTAGTAPRGETVPQLFEVELLRNQIATVKGDQKKTASVSMIPEGLELRESETEEKRISFSRKGRREHQPCSKATYAGTRPGTSPSDPSKFHQETTNGSSRAEFNKEKGETAFNREPLREAARQENAPDSGQGVTHARQVIVIAGNSSPEEVRSRLKQLTRTASSSFGPDDSIMINRRRLQLLTALKPGSPYLPGSQLGPIGGIRLGRGATCPAGFRLGGDLYREKVRLKMKNTFEYLITSNVETNPDGSRRIISPQEVATGVLTNAQLVSGEATRWYNEFVRLPTAVAPALHIGTSAAMDAGRLAALQQLLGS